MYFVTEDQMLDGRSYQIGYPLETAGLLRTKDGLKGEDYELTREVRQLESSYRTLYGPVQELGESYRACKNDMVLFRYKSLKDMIKTCINTYDQLQKEYNKKTRKSENMTGAGAFLETATETRVVMSEVEPLRKAELVQDIEDKKIRRERLKGKFKLLETSVQRLQTEYITSKQYFPTTRYRLMKTMIKQLIRAENLFI